MNGSVTAVYKELVFTVSKQYNHSILLTCMHTVIIAPLVVGFLSAMYVHCNLSLAVILLIAA